MDMPTIKSSMKHNSEPAGSYSDLFEDFFRADVADSMNSASMFPDVDEASLFPNNLSTQSQHQPDYMYPMMQSSDHLSNSDYLFHFQQQQQQQQQQIYQNPGYYGLSGFPTAASPALYSSMIPASVGKPPNYIRNKPNRRVANLKQQHKHIVNAATAAGAMIYPSPPSFDYTAMAGNQQQYSAAYNPISQFSLAPGILPLNPSSHYNNSNQLQNSIQPNLQTMASPISQPTSPRQTAHSPTTSEFIKQKLQQKIRLRMVSKGQIPPNPTEEELRMCGISTPQPPSANDVYPSPPTINQLPRAVNNGGNEGNMAAFIAASSSDAYINSYNQQQAQLQIQQQAHNQVLQYFDLSGGFGAGGNGSYSQKDPLVLVSEGGSNGKTAFDLKPVTSNNSNDPTITYDQFFSDFILY